MEKKCDQCDGVGKIFFMNFTKWPECSSPIKQNRIMENYERLTLDLIGEGLTPKARYEQTKFLLNVYNCYKRAKNTLEDDLEWYGSDHWAHKQSQKIYDILTGKTPCKHERITHADGLDECLDCGCRNF